MAEKTLKMRAPESPAHHQPSEQEMLAWIAEAAYYRAQSRGFQPGGETEDWLAAEAEILARVRSDTGSVAAR